MNWNGVIKSIRINHMSINVPREAAGHIFLYMSLIMARQQVVLSQHYLHVHEPD
jgi:hypothetical protein